MLLPPLDRCSSQYGLEPRFHAFPSGSPAFSALRTSPDKFWHCWASLSHPTVIPGHLGCIWLYFMFFCCCLIWFGLVLVLFLCFCWHLPRPTQLFTSTGFCSGRSSPGTREGCWVLPCKVSSLYWWTTAQRSAKSREPVCTQWTIPLHPVQRRE